MFDFPATHTVSLHRGGHTRNERTRGGTSHIEPLCEMTVDEPSRIHRKFLDLYLPAETMRGQNYVFVPDLAQCTSPHLVHFVCLTRSFFASKSFLWATQSASRPSNARVVLSVWAVVQKWCTISFRLFLNYFEIWHSSICTQKISFSGKNVKIFLPIDRNRDLLIN